MRSTRIMSTDDQLLDFGRRTSQAMGILTQVPISLSGNIVLVSFIFIEHPLQFNMLLGCDYVYAMKFVLSKLFHVMYFPDNESNATINQFYFLDSPPSLDYRESLSFIYSQCFNSHFLATSELCGLIPLVFNCY